ncbi:MAG: trypsin-like peptidase domain-containing protein [Planctomycetes bacterium]|nr:trypsin-like peptidase domain-containing protein [Planctomycetota bacterium]MBI3833582.1 trypsin-like peptidase domain-containing protein [Planctomycetota bacterium]
MGGSTKLSSLGVWLAVPLLVAKSAFAEPRSAPATRAPVNSNPSTIVNFTRTSPVTQPDHWSRDADFVAPALDLDAIKIDDARNQIGSEVPLRIGTNVALSQRISTQSHGKWGTLDDGTIIWTARLQFPGAKGVRLLVTDFHPSINGQLIVTSDPASPGDVYSSKSQRGETEFWTAPATGGALFLEYSQPKSDDVVASVLVIDEVSEFYRSAEENAFDPTSAVVGSVAQTETLACEEDVNCHDVSVEARDSVGRMQYTVSGQGTFVCTGALLNDADPNTFAGYFLTAAHCIDTQAKASSLAVAWFYQSDSCGGTVSSPLSHPQSNGAKLLAVDPASDSALLRLNDDPGNGQGFAAWTTVAPSGTVREIHHPGGSFKRYCEGQLTNAPPTCSQMAISGFFYNKWSTGITEDGSSGAPLFNENWEIVGQQKGYCGFQVPTCTNPEQYNNAAGRFSSAYPLFRQYLDFVATDDSYENSDSFSTAVALPFGSYALRLMDFDDYFAAEFESAAIVTAQAAFDTADMDLDLYLFDSTGTVVAQSAGTTGVEAIIASIPAGRYVLRAHKSHGWGGDYQLDWSAQISTCLQPLPVVVTDPAEKNRFLSIVPGHAGSRTAIRVALYSLHHPDPPYADSSTTGLSDEESSVRWVGQLSIHADVNGNTFHAAQLQCEPFFADWGSMGEVQIYGTEIIPSSDYVIDSIFEFCDLNNFANYSSPLGLRTTRWGDITAPFQMPAPAELTQPNVQDVAAMIATFRTDPAAIPKSRALLQPALVNPEAPISVLDIAAVIDAFRGAAYDLEPPSHCP